MRHSGWGTAILTRAGEGHKDDFGQKPVGPRRLCAFDDQSNDASAMSHNTPIAAPAEPSAMPAILPAEMDPGCTRDSDAIASYGISSTGTGTRVFRWTTIVASCAPMNVALK